MVTFQHDTLGRPIQATANGEVHSFVWDSLPDNTCARGLGRLCEINDPHQHLRLSYTRYGELSRIWPRIQGQGGLLHDRHFDDLGRLQRIVYAGGVEALYHYTLNQVTSVDVRIQGQIRPLITSIEYQAMGPATRYEFGNGNNRVQAFDLDGRVAGTASKTWHGMGFDYDSFGRIEQLTNFRSHAWDQSYGYDALNRLTSAVSPGLGNQGFDHDAVGNRTVHIRDSQLHSHQIDPQNNRVQTISGSAPRSYSYRATGEVASILGPLREDSIQVHGFEAGNSTHFVYDNFQRLSRVHGPGVDARYRVSALGMRVEKQARGRTTRFVYTPEGQLLAEHNVSNNQRSQHIYLHGRPIALVRNQQVYWTQTDHLGRPEVLIDDNGPQGQEVWRATLSAFERNVIKDQIGGYALGFPGQYHDEETSFAYNVFRDYDPRTGRYLQSDPIGLWGGVNTYGYVGGNPVSFVDPLGLDAQVSLEQSSPSFLRFSMVSAFRRGSSIDASVRDTQFTRAVTLPAIVGGLTPSTLGIAASAGPIGVTGCEAALKTEAVREAAFITCVGFGICQDFSLRQYGTHRDRLGDTRTGTTIEAPRQRRRSVITGP